jgi:hypothetical protein
LVVSFSVVVVVVLDVAGGVIGVAGAVVVVVVDSVDLVASVDGAGVGAGAGAGAGVAGTVVVVVEEVVFDVLLPCWPHAASASVRAAEAAMIIVLFMSTPWSVRGGSGRVRVSETLGSKHAKL